MSKTSQSAGRRLSTITIDQGIAGASNVLIAILAARVLGPASFGLFGIVFLLYVTAQGISRALVGEPLLVHPEEAETRGGDILGTACLIGVALAGVVVLGGAVASIWSGSLGAAMVVLGACLPLLVLQDIGRYRAFAVHRPSFALVLDVLWLVLLVVAVVAVTVMDSHSLVLFIAIWGGSGAIAGAVSWRWMSAGRLRLSRVWLRETWTFSSRYLAAYSATQASALAASVAIAGIAGARALGSVQGALLAIRPFLMFQAASIAAGVAEISRLGPDVPVIRRHARRTSAFTSVVAVANMIVLVFLPDTLGKMMLGDTWEVARPLLLAAGSQMLCLGLISGPRSALLGMRAVRKTLPVDVSATVWLLALTIAGALLDGARGAFWAVACGQAVMAAVWWVVLVIHLRQVGVDRPQAGLGHRDQQPAVPAPGLAQS